MLELSTPGSVGALGRNPQSDPAVYCSAKRPYDLNSVFSVVRSRPRGRSIDSEPRADKMRDLGRWRLFGEELAGYAHPALVGTKLYLRGNSSILCIELAQ